MGPVIARVDHLARAGRARELAGGRGRAAAVQRLHPGDAGRDPARGERARRARRRLHRPPAAPVGLQQRVQRHAGAGDRALARVGRRGRPGLRPGIRRAAPPAPAPRRARLRARRDHVRRRGGEPGCWRAVHDVGAAAR